MICAMLLLCNRMFKSSYNFHHFKVQNIINSFVSNNNCSNKIMLIIYDTVYIAIMYNTVCTRTYDIHIVKNALHYMFANVRIVASSFL